MSAARRKDVGGLSVEALRQREAMDCILSLVTDSGADREVRVEAARILGERCLAAIDHHMQEADALEGSVLLSAAIATRAKELPKRLQNHEATLLRILDQETAELVWLTDYFRGRPTPKAVQPLLRSLALHKSDPELRKRLIAALRRCSGKNYGSNADAWIKALAER